MLSTQEAQNLLNNGQVIDSDGDKIGKVGQVFLDDTTNQPAWVTVKTGLFGGAESFVPLDRATMDGDDVSVPYTKDQVKDAPRVEDSEGHLEPHEEEELYSYYGLGGHSENGPAAGGVARGRGDESDGGTHETQAADHSTVTAEDANRPTTEPRTAGHDTSGPDTDNAMTRSEEQLNVGKQTETVGRARLRKFIVTENVTQTVPVSHEEVEVVREPITDANRAEASSGGDLTEEEHEVELKGEHVVVDKDTVPVERVQMGTQTVTENQTVDEDIRKEQIEATGEGTGAGASDAPRDDVRGHDDRS